MLGDQRAVVTEVGAGLRSYRVGGDDILDGYPAGSMSTSGRGQVLAPWPNRLEDGSYELDGRRHELPLSEPATRTAIHGLVRWARWTIGRRDESSVMLEHVLYPQPGYPFTLALSLEYALSGDGLTVHSSATNVGEGACLFGSGAHPYLTVGTPTVDSNELCVPADNVLRSDERGLPVERHAVDGTEFDFRASRPIGPTVLDNAFGDLRRGADGLARVELRAPESGRAVALWVDEAFSMVMVFTGDTLPDVNRRSVAIEPMTCPPNAFRTGEALRLEPGAATAAAWGIAPEPIVRSG